MIISRTLKAIRRHTLRMIDYAVEYVFYTRPEELLRECADAEQKAGYVHS